MEIPSKEILAPPFSPFHRHPRYSLARMVTSFKFLLLFCVFDYFFFLLFGNGVKSTDKANKQPSSLAKLWHVNEN